MKEFIKDKEYVYANMPYTEAYIPDELFGDPEKDSSIASEYAEGIKTIGIFNIRFFNDEDEDRNNLPIRTFNYPNIIETYPTEISVATLEINGILDKYRILKYYKGDIIKNSFAKKSADDSVRFLNYMMSGKIPSSINYIDLFFAWIKNFAINEVNPGVPYVVIQTLVSEICRDSNNLAVPFRKAFVNPEINLHDYVALAISAIASYTSVLSGISFERFSDQLTTSMNMTKDGIKQARSPVEKVLSY